MQSDDDKPSNIVDIATGIACKAQAEDDYDPRKTASILVDGLRCDVDRYMWQALDADVEISDLAEASPDSETAEQFEARDDVRAHHASSDAGYEKIARNHQRIAILTQLYGLCSTCGHEAEASE